MCHATLKAIMGPSIFWSVGLSVRQSVTFDNSSRGHPTVRPLVSHISQCNLLLHCLPAKVPDQPPISHPLPTHMQMRFAVYLALFIVTCDTSVNVHVARCPMCGYCVGRWLIFFFLLSFFVHCCDFCIQYVTYPIRWWLKTMPDTRHDSRGRLGRSRNAKTARNSGLRLTDRATQQSVKSRVRHWYTQWGILVNWLSQVWVLFQQ